MSLCSEKSLGPNKQHISAALTKLMYSRRNIAVNTDYSGYWKTDVKGEQKRALLSVAGD